MAEKLCELRKKGGGGGKYTETSLWTNPNTSSNFATQTVTLSQSVDNFKYIGIKYKYGTTTSDSDYVMAIYSVNALKQSTEATSNVRDGVTLGIHTATNQTWARIVYYVSTTSIKFTDCYRLYNQSSTQNGANPLEILGLNELDHGKNFDETTLWTNNAPTSNFAGQTISLSSDIDNFDYIKVNYRYITSSTAEYSVLASVSELKTYSGNGAGRLAMSETTGGGYFAYRPVTYSSNTALAIGGCGYANGTTFTANNGLCIPTSIVGCKFK